MKTEKFKFSKFGRLPWQIYIKKRPRTNDDDDDDGGERALLTKHDFDYIVYALCIVNMPMNKMYFHTLKRTLIELVRVL